MYCKMGFVATSLMLDKHPWYQLLGLCAPAVVILIWVVVDKPYRCREGNLHGMTQGDWQMVLAQVLQLLSYAIAGVCLMDQESRSSRGDAGLSEDVELFAALAGLAIVLAQVIALSLSLWHGGGSAADTITATGASSATVHVNPMLSESPK